ncbi:MAG: hypothetical protein LBH53_00410 [Puniceicoccales bacterium]|jgi:hypothetical protein|nr:hypothetical protein [Puniceicoccales bacterium]
MAGLLGSPPAREGSLSAVPDAAAAFIQIPNKVELDKLSFLFKAQAKRTKKSVIEAFETFSSGCCLPHRLALACACSADRQLWAKVGRYLRLCLFGANEGDVQLVQQIACAVGVIPQIERPETLRALAGWVDAQKDETSFEAVFDSIGSHYGEEIGAESRKKIAELLDGLMDPYGRKRNGPSWTLGDLRHRNEAMAIHSEKLGCSAEATQGALSAATLSQAGLVALAIAVDQIPGAFAAISAWPSKGVADCYDVRVNLFWGMGMLSAANMDRFEAQVLNPQPSLIIDGLGNGLGQVVDSVFLGTQEDLETILRFISPNAQQTAAAALLAAAQEANAAVDASTISLTTAAAYGTATPLPDGIVFRRQKPGDSPS